MARAHVGRFDWRYTPTHTDVAYVRVGHAWTPTSPEPKKLPGGVFRRRELIEGRLCNVWQNQRRWYAQPAPTHEEKVA